MFKYQFLRPLQKKSVLTPLFPCWYSSLRILIKMKVECCPPAWVFRSTLKLIQRDLKITKSSVYFTLNNLVKVVECMHWDILLLNWVCLITGPRFQLNYINYAHSGSPVFSWICSENNQVWCWDYANVSLHFLFYFNVFPVTLEFLTCAKMHIFWFVLVCYHDKTW